MTTHRWIRAFAALAAPTVLLGCVTAFATQAPSSLAGLRVLADREVSRFTLVTPDACKRGQHDADCVQTDTEIEPSIAVNPEDPMNAVAAFQVGRRDFAGAATTGWATTFDGGQTWNHGLLPHLTERSGGPFERASDAVVAFGPNDTVYINSLVFDAPHALACPECVADRFGLRSGLALSASRDGGATWEDPVFLQDDLAGGTIDKNWIVVDNGDGAGHHKGRVYCVWDRVAPVLAAYSDDGGRTWIGGAVDGLGAGSQSAPPATGGAGFLVYPGQGIGVIPLVLPNGDLAVVFLTEVAPLPVLHPAPGDNISEPIPGVTKIVVSIAAGAGSVPTGGPLVFGTAVSSAVVQPNHVRQQRASDGLPSATVGPDGDITIAWNDGRFRTDVANDVVITRSIDGGLTWSPVQRVNSGPTNDYLDRFNVAVAAADNGSLLISYRQRQEAKQEKPDGSSFSERVDTFLVRSTDRGHTFSAPLKLNSVSNNMYFAAQSRGSAFLGDYEQVATAGNKTYVARAEPMAVDASEPHTFPPRFHHQRMWVAVAGPSGAPALDFGVAPRTPDVLGARTRRGTLPATGLETPIWLPLALGSLALLARRALRPH
jgi:hypothetical protein